MDIIICTVSNAYIGQVSLHSNEKLSIRSIINDRFGKKITKCWACSEIINKEVVRTFNIVYFKLLDFNSFVNEHTFHIMI